MKTTNLFLAVTAVALAALASCQSEPQAKDPDPRGQKVTTYASINIVMPRTSAGKNVRSYNDVGTLTGADVIKTLDVYITTDDQKSIVFSQRFTRDADEIAINSDGVHDVVSPKTAIKTSKGSRWFFIVLNSPEALMTTVPDNTTVFSTAKTPMPKIASVFNTYDKGPVTNILFPSNPPTFDIWPDVTAMTGIATGAITIEDGVTQAEALSGQKNSFKLNVARVASRVIVTKTATTDPVDVIDATSTKLGTVSNITWSVAQGCRDVFLFPQTVAGGSDVNTPAYAYVPGTDYATQAPNLFAYDDLADLATAVPTKPADEHVMWMSGKFLLENTHKFGADDGTSQYKQGNTAYVLVRAKFTPAKFADTGTPPTDGTFYVGANDYFVYTSIDAAKAGTLNQDVMKYPQGKVLYYLWLNPDNFARPFNSPVVRNNIYHINIKGFKSFGYNWNPLDPSPTNPDPKPGDNPNEPPSDIDPSYPMSSSETFVNIDAEILPWSTHSYENEL